MVNSKVVKLMVVKILFCNLSQPYFSTVNNLLITIHNYNNVNKAVNKCIVVDKAVNKY